MFETEYGIEGRLDSAVDVDEAVVWFVGAVKVVAAAAADNGAESVFFTLENREDTIA